MLPSPADNFEAITNNYGPYLQFHASILFLCNDSSDSSLQQNHAVQSLLIARPQHERPTVSLFHYKQNITLTIIIIIIIIIPGQCLWCCHHAVAALREFTLVHAVSAARRQVAADLWTKPIGLNHKPACRLPVNYTHHRHFVITQPES